MEITFRTTKDFTIEQLQDLFLSVKWSSGNYPDKLQVAMKNSHSVFSAWDGEKLVGLMNCLSDGVMTTYFHYLLVRTEYQDQGIGKELVNWMVKTYQDYARKVLIAYDKEMGFYKKCGFEIGEGKTPMSITYLTT
ncbi:MAG: GNAT family N-acetyltransferase [Peptococcaceae bacterium]|nr:GNAT family N-acetyltransferase [Peptococcaceae bacterium]